MDITKQIIEAIDELGEPTIFDKYRLILKTNKKLKRNGWLNFRKLMKTNFIFDVLQQDLTVREAQIVKSCIKSISLKDYEKVVEAIIKKGDNNTPYLLEGLLSKRKKFNLNVIKEYLNNKNEVPSSLMEVIKKNYPQLFDS